VPGWEGGGGTPRQLAMCTLRAGTPANVVLQYGQTTPIIFPVGRGRGARGGGAGEVRAQHQRLLGSPLLLVVLLSILIRARHWGLLGSPLVVLWSILIRARHRGLLGSPLVVLWSILIRAQHRWLLGSPRTIHLRLVVRMLMAGSLRPFVLAVGLLRG
jgi:hypothetical protein